MQNRSVSCLPSDDMGNLWKSGGGGVQLSLLHEKLAVDWLHGAAGR